MYALLSCFYLLCWKPLDSISLPQSTLTSMNILLNATALQWGARCKNLRLRQTLHFTKKPCTCFILIAALFLGANHSTAFVCSHNQRVITIIGRKGTLSKFHRHLSDSDGLGYCIYLRRTKHAFTRLPIGFCGTIQFFLRVKHFSVV